MGVLASGEIPAGATAGQLSILVDRLVPAQTLDVIQVVGTAGSLTHSVRFILVVASPLPASQISPDLVQASGGLQRGVGGLENTTVILEPVVASTSKDATEKTEVRHGFRPAAASN